MKGENKKFSQLNGKNQRTNLALLVDIMGISNNLNIVLQGKESLTHESYAVLKAFQMKLLLYSKQTTENKFTHFCTLQIMLVSTSQTNKYSNILCKLHKELCQRSKDFGKVESSIDLLAAPFSCNVKKAPNNLQLELINLLSDNELKHKYISLSLLNFMSA